VGSFALRSFYVTNTGGLLLEGSASAPPPFSIVSGATYHLEANQGQAVVVAYTPTSPVSNTSTITFSGAAGATCTLSGSANSPNLSLTPTLLDFGAVALAQQMIAAFLSPILEAKPLRVSLI